MDINQIYQTAQQQANEWAMTRNPQMQTGGMGSMGGMGGANPMSGYLSFLQSWAAQNPDNQKLAQMAAEETMQYNNPYVQWQMQQEMQNAQQENAFQMMDMAALFLQSSDPQTQRIGQALISNMASGYGEQAGIGTGLPTIAESARGTLEDEAQKALVRGDFEKYDQYMALMGSGKEQNYRTYLQRPSFWERISRIRPEEISGYALAGAGTGAGIGAGLGSVVPVLGTGIGAVGGTAIGALGGTIAALSRALQDEEIKLGRTGYSY